MPEDALMHDNGVWYRELKVDGVKDSIKLFNTLKPGRLDGETSTEYKIRRKLLNHKKETKVLFYDSSNKEPYINTNKKDKFKKKK